MSEPGDGPAAPFVTGPFLDNSPIT